MLSASEDMVVLSVVRLWLEAKESITVEAVDEDVVRVSCEEHGNQLSLMRLLPPFPPAAVAGLAAFSCASSMCTSSEMEAWCEQVGKFCISLPNCL